MSNMVVATTGTIKTMTCRYERTRSNTSTAIIIRQLIATHPVTWEMKMKMGSKAKGRRAQKATTMTKTITLRLMNGRSSQ